MSHVFINPILCFIVCISADISLPDFYTDSDLVFHKLAQHELIKQKKEKSRKGKVASEKPSLSNYSKKSIKKVSSAKAAILNDPKKPVPRKVTSVQRPIFNHKEMPNTHHTTSFH